MSLNAPPSEANSSWPRTGTRSVSRPRAIAWAASDRERSVRTIERPSKYATSETSASEASSPISRRLRRLRFASSISDCGLRTAKRTCGTSPIIGATSARRRMPATSIVFVRPGASATEPLTAGEEATIRDRSSRTSASEEERPDRARSRVTREASSGT